MRCQNILNGGLTTLTIVIMSFFALQVNALADESLYKLFDQIHELDSNKKNEGGFGLVDASSEELFFDEVLDKIQSNCDGRLGVDYLNCWSDFSPKKCKGLVFIKDKSSWARCVYSCANAGFFSKWLGECSN